jgi:penicillin-binding protein 2
VALILENGGSDGVTAAPVMRQIMDHLFAPQDNAAQTEVTQQSGPLAAVPSVTAFSG